MRLEALGEGVADRVLEAEDTGARLVEVVQQRDVEVADVGAETQVDVGKGVLVRAVDLDGAARQRPLGAACGV